MLKYVDTQVTFAEVPDQITLCINISNCPCHCEGCHSSYLAEDIGEELDKDTIRRLIRENTGISCICFMGGDSEPRYISYYASWIKEEFPKLKIAWYSGRQELTKQIDIDNFDFIKLGPYKAECGPLNKRTTNQKFYRIVKLSSGKSKMYDITYKFWRDQ